MAVYDVIIREPLAGSSAFELADTINSLALDRVDGVRLSFTTRAGIDVTGVAMLVRLYSRLRAAGKSLTLGDVPPHVQQTLDAVGLTTMLAPAPLPRMLWTGSQTRATV